MQTIALHDLYTKCSPTVQRSLQGFACNSVVMVLLVIPKLPWTDPV